MIEVTRAFTEQLVILNSNQLKVIEAVTKLATLLEKVDGRFQNGFKKDITEAVASTIKTEHKNTFTKLVLSSTGVLTIFTAIIYILDKLTGK